MVSFPLPDRQAETEQPREEKMNKRSLPAGLTISLVLGLLGLFWPNTALAHCDTLDGPVVATARTALEVGEATPTLKWVRPEDEEEIRAAFARTMAVRAQGEEARELADLYFFETLVRIHRAAEGAPYTGLKPGGTVDPAVAMADQALAEGSVDDLVETLSSAMANGIRERFQHAAETQQQADESVEAGREFVEAYVSFTHYVEGLHAIIQGADGHYGETEMDVVGHGH
jgi:hypothetical protein